MSQLAPPEPEVTRHSRVPAMRIKRRLVGGIATLGVIIGAYFSGLIPGLGSGSGDGDGTAGPSDTTVSTEAAEQPAEAPAQPEPTEATEPATPPTTAASEPAAPAEPPKIETLDVYVDGRSYAVPLRNGGHRRVSAAVIMRLAKSTTGDEDGIRIRVLRTKDARYTSWAQLVQELEDTLGIPKDAISVPEKMVELPGEEENAET